METNMKTHKTINFYSDPAHGWAKVNKAELKRLNIADKITPFSYQRKDYAYLEEDCDLQTYINALRNKGIITLIYREHPTMGKSKIRNYPCYCNI